MKKFKKFMMFLRGAIFYCEDTGTRKQQSLGTKDRHTAARLLNAKNEAHEQPIINLQIARAYLMVSDPEVLTRTWQYVIGEMLKLKSGETEHRWKTAVKDEALNGIRDLSLLQTRAEHFLRAMEVGKVSTNVYLRRTHNFDLGMNWLPVPASQCDIAFLEVRTSTGRTNQNQSCQTLQRRRSPYSAA